MFVIILLGASTTVRVRSAQNAPHFGARFTVTPGSSVSACHAVLEAQVLFVRLWNAHRDNAVIHTPVGIHRRKILGQQASVRVGIRREDCGRLGHRFE